MTLSDAPLSDFDTRQLQRAIALSREALQSGRGGPFGAVVTRGEDFVGEGGNQVFATHDPTAHAEITAIRAACANRQNEDLTGCTIYSSCEPCPMCLGAIYWSGIRRIVYAASGSDAETAGFGDVMLVRQMGLPESERDIAFQTGLRDDARAVLTDGATVAGQYIFGCHNAART